MDFVEALRITHPVSSHTPSALHLALLLWHQAALEAQQSMHPGGPSHHAQLVQRRTRPILLMARFPPEINRSMRPFLLYVRSRSIVIA